MKLGELFSRAGNGHPEFVSMYRYVDTNGLKDLEIVGITDDSRKVKPGYLFVAIKGLEHDGHKYIEQAIEKGAVAVVLDVNFKFQPASPKPQRGEISNFKFGDVAMIAADNTRLALGLLWAAWYHFPADKLKVVGITGTDGKTTTANLLYHILKESGKKVGLISTINARIGDLEIDTGFHVTSPDPELLQKLLSEMVEAGLEYVVLEVTSHGIDQERIAGVNFVGAAITNVTHEHLDYHKNYQSYLQTKSFLFKNLTFSVLNKDDESFGYLNTQATGKIVTYSLKERADFLAKNILLKDARSYWELEEKTSGHLIGINLHLPGFYNVSNALVAIACARNLGLDLTQIKIGLESFSGLIGRFEMIGVGQEFKVIVDFAHTPNALKQVLEQITNLKSQNSKTILVFGCAGERDKEKRPMMGEIAGRLSDLTIITAEDPRRESLTDIINNISEGCIKAGAKEIFNFQFSIFKKGSTNFFVRIPNRREAIEMAVSAAKKDDIVLITGKGHEKSMCFGTTEYPWSDQKVARKALNKVKYKL